MKTNLVTKSNALIEASYRLSLTEIQVILYGVALLNPTEKVIPSEYRIDIGRFADQFDRRHGEIYESIKESIKKRFWERDFSYTNEDGRTVTCRWLTRITHEDKSGYIKIKFSEDVQPYLHMLKNNFTSYYIEQVAKFKSVYSIRIYEMGVMHLNRCHNSKSVFKLNVAELNKRLELENSYTRFSNFKARVIDAARKEINKHSDITLNYEVLKLGRTPHEIKFTVTRKKAQEQQLSFDGSTETQKKIGQKTLEKAKDMTLKAQTGWDFYVIEQQFYDIIKTKGAPDNLDGAFIGFVKKKIAKSP